MEQPVNPIFVFECIVLCAVALCTGIRTIVTVVREGGDVLSKVTVVLSIALAAAAATALIIHLVRR